MEYIGRVKVGRLKPKPEQELAIIRLPMSLKDLIGLYCHIWKIDDRTFIMQFNDKKEAVQPTIHLTVQSTIQQSVTEHTEDRISKLEKEIEELKKLILKDKNKEPVNNLEKCSGRDLNPGHGIESPV